MAPSIRGLLPPQIHSTHSGHCIEELDVDPRCEVYPISKVDADTMSAVLEQIPVSS
jgi:hypothetical protein